MLWIDLGVESAAIVTTRQDSEAPVLVELALSGHLGALLGRDVEAGYELELRFLFCRMKRHLCKLKSSHSNSDYSRLAEEVAY